MTKLYRSKDRLVREVDDGPGSRVRLLCLKQAGFVVGELPPAPKPKEPVVEKPLPATEGEEVDADSEGKVVLAEHEPIATPATPLQEVKDEEAEVDDAATEDAVAEDAAEDDDALTEALTGSDEEEAHDPTEGDEEPDGKDEDGEAGGADDPEEGEEEDG